MGRYKKAGYLGLVLGSPLALVGLAFLLAGKVGVGLPFLLLGLAGALLPAVVAGRKPAGPASTQPPDREHAEPGAAADGGGIRGS